MRNSWSLGGAAWALSLASLVGACTPVRAPAEERPLPRFSSREDLRQAIRAGQIKVIDRDMPVPKTVEVKKAIAYGTGGETELKLDVYRPNWLDQPVPGLVLIHGGGWAGGKRSDCQYYGIWFAQRGYVAVSITYRLSREAPFPAAVHDAKCAVRWLRAHADRLGVDPTKIAVVGGSAGGHLAMMVGYSAEVASLEGSGGHADVSSRVQAVVNLYGPADLTPLGLGNDPDAQRVVQQFLGGKDFDETPEMYRLASPIHHLSPDDPPTLVLHGTIDQIVPVRQSDALVQKLKELGVPYRYERLEGWPHAMDLAEVVNRHCRSVMVEFFQRHLPLPK